MGGGWDEHSLYAHAEGRFKTTKNNTHTRGGEAVNVVAYTQAVPLKGVKVDMRGFIGGP